MFSKSTVKYIQSLQHKKFRDELNVFIGEGPKLVTELLLANTFKCKAIYAVQEWVATLEKNLTHSLTDRIEIVKDFELEKIASYSTANKVVAVFEKKPAVDNVSFNNKLTLVLDDIQDPGNMGTIIRTADWFGIENIICTKNSVDIYNPKVVQSTMASLGRVNVLYKDISAWLQDTSGIPKIAATLNGKPLNKVAPLQEAILVIGNESKGISEQILNLVDEQITIPKIGSAESLNAAVATSIILYALKVGK